MKYMVMECHVSYAVVLDEEGRFLNVANRHYEVGQTVTDVIELQIPQSVTSKKKTNKWLYSLVATAACLLLMVTLVLQMGRMTYASVYMTINPEVRIDVNRKDVVVGLDGINPDGDDLIQGYDYKKKDLDLVMDELVDLAIQMGYLHEGGQISLVLDADNDEWVISHSDTLTTHLNDHLDKTISITIEITDKSEKMDPVVIPIGPDESDYGESDYGEIEPTPTPSVTTDADGSNSEDQDTDEGQTDYGDNSYDDGQSNYNADEGQSDYNDTDDAEDGESDFDEED